MTAKQPQVPRAKPVAKRAPKKSDKNAPTQPRLLSGGNPQIPLGDGDAPVQAYLAAMPGWKQVVGRRIDSLIARNVPNVRQAVKWNSPLYASEDRGWFLSIHCFTKYVKFSFFDGALLRPLPPIEAKSEGVRYFHIYEKDEIDDELLTNWIQQAAKLPGWIT